MGWHRGLTLWASYHVADLATRAHGADRERLADQAGQLLRRGFAVELAAMLDGVA